MNQVLLINNNDEMVGTYDKVLAHEEGLLHRAFSVFIFNSKGQLLIQQRAATKYHSPNLWTNTCCGHPLGNNTLIDDATQRLQEELGFTCELTSIFAFKYHEKVSSTMFENEYDHILIGRSDAVPTPNPIEVQDYDYQTIESINRQLYQTPSIYTAWFKLIILRFPTLLLIEKNKLLAKAK